MQEPGKSIPPEDGTKKTVKALILSGLVCPGFGQLALKRKKRGLILIIAALLIVMAIMVKIFFITQELMTPELMMDFSTESFYSAFILIRHRVYAETVPYLLTFLGVWLIGITDILVV